MIEVWPVIHVRDVIQTCEMAAMARHHGCAGVMLIHMEGKDDETDHVSRRLIGDPLHTDFLIGVNYLSLTAPEAYARAERLGYDAMWTDRQMFTRGELSSEAHALIAMARPSWATDLPAHKIFVAVAFKGQEADPFPGDSAGLAAHYGFIPTTSGPSTGRAPPLQKIEQIRNVINLGSRGSPLAIASGVTPENAADFVRAGATHILVATGISRDFHTFDEGKLAALMTAVRS